MTKILTEQEVDEIAKEASLPWGKARMNPSQTVSALISTLEHYRAEVERLKDTQAARDQAALQVINALKAEVERERQNSELLRQHNQEEADTIAKLHADVERLKERDLSWTQTVEKRESQITALTAERDRFREQRDNESWMHAACLSIAEGIAGWKEMPPENDSLAMIKVRQLRQDYEAEKRENAELKKAVNDVSDIVASIWGAGKITEAQVVELKSVVLRCQPKEGETK